MITSDEEEDFEDLANGVVANYVPSAKRVSYMQGRLDVDLAGAKQGLDDLGSSSPEGPPPGVTPKVAFIFLLGDGVDNEDVWDKFFESAPTAQFSVYTHRCCADGGEGPLERWGAVRVPLANQSWCALAGLEVAVYAHALRDPANVQFVLLSQNAVPLKRFSYVYRHLVEKSAETSKICFASPAAHPDSAVWEHVKNDVMKRCQFIDFFSSKDMRVKKHHQWLVLSRRHAHTFVRMSELALNTFQTAWRLSAPDVKDGGDGCSDEAVVGTAILLDVEQRGMSTLNPWQAFEDDGVEQSCLTWLRWRNCFRKSKFDLTDSHAVSVVKAMSSFRFGDIRAQPDESGRTPGQLRITKKLNGFPHYFGQVHIDYLKALTQEAFMFGRKFNVGATVRMHHGNVTLAERVRAPPVKPLVEVLPELWDLVDEEEAPKRVWSRLEVKGEPGKPLQSPETEAMEVKVRKVKEKQEKKVE